ncbi:hypothetical protein BDN71DRAFT_1451284 [Pleurotus eryngii]|uniref:Protein root UVB sensitive/RUS domain-containing protein n=1 Tax=Pleurotus eryngii TaxID=5323 RepID=A0A9P6DD98_PLEER|nr:hypothetical protein BDN71DRAFT_1451284 [Pleurotus eryngii]
MGEFELHVTEKDEAGRKHRTRYAGDSAHTILHGRAHSRTGAKTTTIQLDNVLAFLGKVFLPSGYPDTVSPDYMRYQIMNALQAFCSSLATLISNRAVLEGMGVGDASATATNALLLSVLQDVFGRLTTIIGAYHFGSSLYPEAKLYRMLADVLNDGAIVLDALSPLLVAHSSSRSYFSLRGIRVAALCLSSTLRSLCGIVAGGSKAAITLHFASPLHGKGDVGDLNAKDASKETVLALSGMLLGTLIVPYLKTASTIYPVLLSLILLHLLINYVGVRGLELRSLNRQRMGIAWLAYAHAHPTSKDVTQPQGVLTPVEVALRERIFERPSVIRDPFTHRVLAACHIGTTSLRALTMASKAKARTLPSCRSQDLKSWTDVFAKERYLLVCECAHTEVSSSSAPRITMHVLLKDGHSAIDHLKAWAHASEAAFLLHQLPPPASHNDGEDLLHVVEQSYRELERNGRWNAWVGGMKRAGWDVGEGAVLAGAPKVVIVEIGGSDYRIEDRKQV